MKFIRNKFRKSKK